MQFDYTFVTCSKLPDLDPDDAAVADWLRARGVRVGAAIWNDPSVDWQNAGTCVIRSTWDYHLTPAQFLAWAKLVSKNGLINPLSLVTWNAEKTYLLDLESKGASIIPTRIISQIDELSAILADQHFDDLVAKPAVGLSTFGVRRFTGAGEREAAREHVRNLLQTGKVLLQPYLPAVETTGERALVFIAGQYSHAIQKTPFQYLAPAGFAGEKVVEPESEEIESAEAVLALLDQVPLYARVDLVADQEGRPCIMELELIEPSLYCSMYRPAIERFGKALLNEFQRRPTAARKPSVSVSR